MCVRRADDAAHVFRRASTDARQRAPRTLGGPAADEPVNSRDAKLDAAESLTGNGRGQLWPPVSGVARVERQVDSVPELAQSGDGDLNALNDGSSAVAAALADVGITHRVAWMSGAVMFGGGGAVCLALSAVAPGLVPGVGDFAYLGLAALVFGALSLWVAQRAEQSRWVVKWGTQLRMAGGLVVLVIATIILKDRSLAFVLLAMIGLPSAAYLMPPRSSLVYLVVVASLVMANALRIDEPAKVAHALVTTLVCVVVAAALLATRERTRRMAQRNRELARTDPLTGIANLRRLREGIGVRLGAAAQGEEFALFAIDLDNFKQVNDVFDHSMGDHVLCAVAQALVATCDPRDLVARRGGDEFSVFVPSAGARDLDALRERCAAAIEYARAIACPDIRPSASVAYVRSRPGESIGLLIERADAALHDAKIASRRRVGGSELRLAMPAPTHPKPEGAVLVQARAPERPHPSARSAKARTDGMLGRALAATGSPWVAGALVLLIVAVMLTVVSVCGLVRPLGPLDGAALAAAVALTALACAIAGALHAPMRWLNLPWLLAIALLSVSIALAGRSGAALLDFLPLIALYGFLLFGSRVAILYMLLADVLYGVLAIGGGFPYGVARTFATVVAVALIGGLVAKLRTVSIRFARRYRELSQVDALTGLANVRAARGRLSDVVTRAQAQGHRPALVTIDLDEFKPANDRHSHSTGDKVLATVARAIATSVRIDELVARRGGDEFLVVIEDVDPDHLGEVRDRIGEAVIRARQRVCPDLWPTASIACVSWIPGETADALLQRGDEALHSAKLASRARRRLDRSAPAPSRSLA